MIARRWASIGVLLLAAIALVLATTTRSTPPPSSPRPGSSSPVPVATGSHTVEPRHGPTRAFSEVVAGLKVDGWPQMDAPPEPDVRPWSDVTRMEPTPPEGGRHQELLKDYGALWTTRDAGGLRAAEKDLLDGLDALPPRELVSLLRQGLSTRSLNLVLITLENAMRGGRRGDYEDALVVGMESVFEQPDKLEILSDVALRFNRSSQNAEVAARLLMKRAPEGKLAEYLGAFAAQLEGDARRDVKQFAVQHNLIEALGPLVDDLADVARLQRYLDQPTMRDRARRALEVAHASVANDDLRRYIQGALTK